MIGVCTSHVQDVCGAKVETLTIMAASSRSATASSARACEACVTGTFRSRPGLVSRAGDFMGGSISLTTSSFICGVVEVATAAMYGFVGQSWTSEGVNATHALE